MASKKEQEAARKRSEAAKKAAETRRRKAEAQAQEQASQDEAPSREEVVQPDVPEVETFRADVNPGDQQAAEERRQEQLDAEREEHNLRTGGFKY